MKLNALTADFIKVGDGYLRESFLPTDILYRNAFEALDGVKYDTMIGTGLSGSLVIPRLAERLGKHYAIVRKPGEPSHAYAKNNIEGHIGKRWIFVDDFIGTGKTRAFVMKQVEEFMKRHRNVSLPRTRREFTTEYAGSYLYNSSYFELPACACSLCKEMEKANVKNIEEQKVPQGRAKPCADVEFVV